MAHIFNDVRQSIKNGCAFISFSLLKLHYDTLPVRRTTLLSPLLKLPDDVVRDLSSFSL
jgi:hypothetical protein